MTVSPDKNHTPMRWLQAAAVALVGLDLAMLAATWWGGPTDPESTLWLRVATSLLTVALVLVLVALLRAAMLVQARQAAAYEQLGQIVQALPASVAVFDADDRLQAWNRDFAALYEPYVPVRAGTRFEDLLRPVVQAGAIPEAVGREEAWLARRLQAHRSPGPPLVRRLGENTWRRVMEQRLADGGTLIHSTDISDLMRNEQALDQARRDASLAHQRLADAIEALPASFELYDEHDRLVLHNSELERLYPELRPHFARGASWQELLRANVALGGRPEAQGQEQAWMAQRQRERDALTGTNSMLMQTPDGRWLRKYETRLRSGGVVAIRVDVTELQRQRAELEAARRRAEVATERLETALDVLPAGFELYDADDRLVLTNRRMHELYSQIADVLDKGLRFEELVRINRARGTLMPQLDDAGFEAWLAERLLQRRSGGGAPRLFQLHDGRWVRSFDMPTRGGGLVGVRIDVTELVEQGQELDKARRRAELAQQRLEAAVEAMPAGFELFDADDRLVMSNQRLREMFPALARHADQPATYEWFLRENHRLGLLLPELDEAAFEAWVSERLARRRAGGGEFLHRFADGRWVQTYERRTADGGCIAVRLDVTEQQRSREELARERGRALLAQRRLEDAIDAMPAGFELYDAEDRLVVCNARLRAMFPAVAEMLAEGGHRFEDLVRASRARGAFMAHLSDEDFADWLHQRLQDRRKGGAPMLVHVGDSWYRNYERVTSEGGVVGVRIDVTELVERDRQLSELNALLATANAELAMQSETDALTGLANRRHFDRRLAEEVARARRHGLALALLLVDVDHFKDYNDCYGHPAGDAALRAVALALQAAAQRPNDLAARIGGEEFAVLLPHCGAAQAAAIAQRVLDGVAGLALPHRTSPVAPHVTVSVGVASLEPPGSPQAADPAALLKAADAALYSAKQAGRHRVALHGG